MGSNAKHGTFYTLVLMRHGESAENSGNRFCGWYDADLSELGEREARAAGKILKDEGYTFDIAFTSVLKRAIKTLNYILDELDLHWIPVDKNWRLNERHYGALQGVNKSDTAAKYGEQQVKIWRRSYTVPPPPLEITDPRWPGYQSKYAFVDKKLIPRHECLKDVLERVLPHWYDAIVPSVKCGQKVLICAHGSSVRSLVKYLDSISDDDIMGVNIPTGIPLVYELDCDLKPIRHFYLGDQEKVQAAIQKVVDQGKVKT